jgi:hypothetical protein
MDCAARVADHPGRSMGMAPGLRADEEQEQE